MAKTYASAARGQSTRKRKIKCIWMEVTPDEYEFPVRMADSAEELARICGVSYGTVVSCVSRRESGERKGGKYVRVWR